MICARFKEMDFYLTQAKYCFQVKIVQTGIGLGLADF